MKGADLTAQVRHGNLCGAVNEIIDACGEKGVRVTLLKGISISEQHYPAGHLRSMGDIDILVPARDYELVESTFLRQGYIPKPDYEVDQWSPHGAPMFHPQRQVWFEVHTALFPGNTGLRSNETFSPESVAAQSVASTFHGRPVFRLANELQLVYIASYWVRDLARNGFHPSFVVPLLDAIYLLKASGPSLDWDGLLAHLDNDLAIASLYIMLDYLSRRGLVHCASPIVPRLASRQRIVGAMECRLISVMLDAYLVGDTALSGPFMDRHPMIAQSILNTLLGEGSHTGKLLSLPWNLVFPPGVPDRYSLRYHRERVMRLLKSSD